MKNRALPMALICGLVLLPSAAIGWRLLSEPTTSWATPNTPTVILSGARVVHASAAVADFDGDGDQEIVIGGKDGMLYVVAYDGSSWSVVWSRQTVLDLNAAGAPGACVTTQESGIRASADIADLDRDGQLEIVIATGGNPGDHRHGGVLVYTFKHAWSFALVPGWPQPRIDEIGAGDGIRYPDGCWDGFSASTAVGDLDGDGDLEIVTENLNRRIYAWHHTGSAVAGWPIHRDNNDNLLRGGTSTPALGDIDGDGLPEVVIGTNSPPWDGRSAPDYSKATVWAINGDSSNVPNWPVVTENNISSSPALGDIDGDGELEVVVGGGKSTEGGTGHRVYAWNGDGSAVAGWPKTTTGDIPSSPALGDLDGDGDLEVVVGCGVENDPANCVSLYAWHDDGSLVDGFPVIPPANDPVSSSPTGLPYPPLLADYDGDGQVETLVVHYQARGVSTIKPDGIPNNEVALQSDSTISSSPLVDDVDNDGKLEMVVVGATQRYTQGAVYVWDLEGDRDAALPWPMFHHDIYRTGNYTFVPDSTPPQNPTVTSSTHTPGVWSNVNVVQLSLSGADDEESGIAGYYYLWDTSPTTTVSFSGSWLDASQNTLSRHLDDGSSWYFHIRALNRATMLAAHTVHFGPFRIDTNPPVSAVNAPLCAILTVRASWSGTDTGSGVLNYDVQVRREGQSLWTNWLPRTPATSGVYSNTTGNVYEFRSLARDLAGNVETKSSITADTQTWLTQYGFSGTVYNVQEDPVFLADVTANPSALLPVTTDSEGAYLICHQNPVAYSLTASRSDFALLPAVKGLTGTVAGLDFYLPPTDDAVVNGQFEAGDLTGWAMATSGTGAVNVTSAARSGDFAAVSSGSSTFWTAALSQTIALPAALDEPVLSLVYRAGASSSAWVAVQGPAQSLTQPLTPSATDWSHIWMDLSAFQGQSITIGLNADSGGREGWLVVDEVSLGTPQPGVHRVYLPMTSRQD